jgi:hypothetical protein
VGTLTPEVITSLKEGKEVQFRPKGKSMEGRVSSGQLCTVSPIGDRILKKDDVVLCTVRINQKEHIYLHLIKDISTADEMYLIGNNKGRINGWIHKQFIHGILTKVENDERRLQSNP